MLLYAPGDRFLQELFIENEYPSAQSVHRVYDFLRGLDADPIELTHAEIKAEAGLDLNEQAIGTALKILEGAGAIEKFLPRENMAIVRINAEDEGDEASLVGRLHPQANIQRVVLMGLEGLVNRRLGEPVYFHPDDFAKALGLDRPALNRALRALVAELPIDYVPPFRGNALRVLDRARRPRDLGIDFAALEERKRREYDKLDRMIRYAQAVQCRRSFILDYFGDAQADRTHCGHCDNCGPRGDLRSSGIAANARAAIDSDAGREVILKVLSGVARAKGRFGKTTVAQMLTGSGAEKMDRWGLKRLSTFGILPEFRQPEVVGLLDALSSAGLVECSEVDRFRPVVNLTATGWERLRAKDLGTLELSLPEELSAKVQFGGMERRSVSSPPAPHALLPPSPTSRRVNPSGRAPRDFEGRCTIRRSPSRASVTGTRSAIGSGRSGSNRRARRSSRPIASSPTRRSRRWSGSVLGRPRPWRRSRGWALPGSNAMARPCWRPSPHVRRPRGLRQPLPPGDGSAPRA